MEEEAENKELFAKKSKYRIIISKIFFGDYTNTSTSAQAAGSQWVSLASPELSKWQADLLIKDLMEALPGACCAPGWA